jgi:hypothetical protein
MFDANTETDPVGRAVLEFVAAHCPK